MTLLHRLASIVRWIARRKRVEQDLNDELQSYIEMAAADEVRDGATPAEARRRAALQLGGLEQTKERVRSGRHGAWLDVVGQDISYGWRQVRRNRSFSALAIATLALGIGGITAMFSVFDAVLIRPLPYADADRLVMIWVDNTKADPASRTLGRHDATPWEWIEWRRQNTVFTDLACTQSGDVTISGDGEPEQVPARKASWNLWSVLGVQPQLGRVFTEDEDNNGVKVVVIGHGLWQRRFGGAADIIGRRISLNDEMHEVVGVLPRNFYFIPSREIDLWLPAFFPAWMRKSQGWHNAHIVARLEPGVTLEHAERAMDALSLQVTAKIFSGPRSVILRPLRQEIAGRTRTADLGMKSEQLLTFETPLFRYKEFERRAAFINAEVEKVRAVPGVISAGFINWIPLTNTHNATFYLLEGQSTNDTRQQVALMRNVSTGYFTTIGAQLREGRHFNTSDRKSSPYVAIVNEAFANRHFGSGSPLGKRFKYGNLGNKGYWYTIVGVVKQIRESSVLEEMRPTVYRIHEQCDQTGDLGGGIAIRTALDPASIVPAVREAIWSLDKNQPLARIRMMEEIVARELSTSTQSTALLSAFALLALLLASLGIYGVLSYAVTQRTNEIGVRMALGATSGGVMLSIGGRGLALTLTGLAIGLVVAVFASRSMTMLLYGFRPDYVPIAAVVSLILVGIAALATFVPARRASRIDPMIALRQE